ncbi:MAG: hypothetical protein GY762_09535 [Proteobacteria bacterium]|nr:hypothetical protein [Pseudomonadota bacterium]
MSVSVDHESEADDRGIEDVLVGVEVIDVVAGIERSGDREARGIGVLRVRHPEGPAHSEDDVPGDLRLICQRG